MSRLIVGALFAAFTASTAGRLADEAQVAAATSGLRPWLVVGFWGLKLAIAAAFAYFIVVRPPARRTARDVVAFLACAAAVLGVVLLRAPSAPSSTATLAAGELVALAGAAWVLASVLVLGRCFGFLPEARGLVTRGPYRVVRHPVYLGELVMAAGLVLAAPTAWNAVAAAVLLGGQLVRMRLEERALWREFSEYGAYAARTPRIVPSIVRPPRRALAPVAVGLLVLLAVTVTHAAGAGAAVKRAGARLAAPAQLAPADGVSVPAVPPFSWRPVRRAARYEFQLSADSRFRSIVSQGSFFTHNTYAGVAGTLADGDYFWRVRAIDAKARAGRWSRVRSLHKGWTDRPVLLGPADGAAVTYPRTPLVLRWSEVPYAYKYSVTIATDPGLAHSALGDSIPSVPTSANAFAMPWSLAPGRYYWAVTPLDADKHPGARSVVAAFDWTWPTTTRPVVTDVDPDPRVFDPRFSWGVVPGAARYEVEVNSSEDFPTGSRVCCDDPATGTSMSPTRLLPNNTYYWRVRAIDADGNAGVWNTGPAFAKTFDEVTPTVPRLRMRDNLADSAPAAGASGFPTTASPVVAWDPVAGASSYEVTLAPWEAPGFCNWTESNPAGPTARTWDTATTAWTELGPSTFTKPVGNAFPTVATEFGWHLVNGTSYCVRVRARSDRDSKINEVVSDWTQLGGVGHAAFTFSEPAQTCTPASMPAANYRGPQAGSLSPRTPLFTWTAVPGACGYFVVVARDPDFTKIIDVALTNEPAYAPRTGFAVTTYPDETTSYYWAVMPTRDANGGGLSTQPQQDFPQAFQKRSVPPQALAPASGATVAGQPVFSWTRAEGARDYRLQVDDDPTFGSPIADVVTNATSYTSTSTLPADSTLYWRVRADDENKVGLTWSATRAFRRRLPVPALVANPQSGVAIPVLAWQSVDGAVSYDMHVEQADGTKRDFTMRASAFTPTAFYGTGVWHWQVRANFRSGFQTVSGGYSASQPFARQIATPAVIRTRKANGGILLSWDPALMAHRYRVQIATDDSFSTIVEQAMVANTSYAPLMANPAFANGSRLYWRVATVDEGFNAGGWKSAPIRNARPIRVRLRGRLHKGHRGRIRATVTDARRRVLRGATVRLAGAGVTGSRRTSRRGKATFRVKPLVRGTVTVTVEKRGYAPVKKKLRVR